MSSSASVSVCKSINGICDNAGNIWGSGVVALAVMAGGASGIWGSGIVTSTVIAGRAGRDESVLMVGTLNCDSETGIIDVSSTIGVFWRLSAISSVGGTVASSGCTFDGAKFSCEIRRVTCLVWRLRLMPMIRSSFLLRDDGFHGSTQLRSTSSSLSETLRLTSQVSSSSASVSSVTVTGSCSL